MVRAFAEREFHIPPSRTALAGWLAAELPEFRSVVLGERPDVVLFGGDPDLLTDQEIETGLAGIAAELLTGPTHRYPRSGILRKLARPSVEGLVFSLLSTRPTTQSLQLLALELVKHGRYRTCVPLAISLALDANTTEYVRTEAISAVIEAGDAAARSQLISLTSDPSPRVRAQLLDVVPQTISGAALVQLMQRGGKLEFRICLGGMVGRVSDRDLEAIAVALAPVLGRTVVDMQTELAYCAALPVVTESIRRGRASVAVIRILRSIEWLIDHAAVFISDEEVAELRDAFEGHARCRHALIETRLVDGLAHPHNTRARFGQATIEDARWLANAWTKSRREERRRAHGRTPAPTAAQRSNLIGWLLEELHGRLQGDEQAQVRAALPKQLQVYVDARAQQSREIEQAQASNEAKRRRQASAKRSKNAKGIRPRLKKIESGDDVDALIRAWQHLGEEQGTKRARRDVSRLAEIVGAEFVPSFLRGLQAYWRKNTVAVPDPSDNAILLKDLAGLTGLTLEIDNGLDLNALSPDEARQAATYALYELNSFPAWFEDLLAAHPVATKAVLQQAILRAWTVAQEKLTLLRFGPYAGKPVALMLRGLLLEVAVTTRPGSRQALEDGIDTLLTSGDDPRLVARIAIVGLTTDAGDDGRLAQWLRLLAHVDPIAAAGHLESMRTTDPERYKRIIETVANFLEQDVSDRYRMSLVTAMHSPRALGRWFRLLLLGVSPETDLEFPTEKMRVIGARDHAQGFRDRCVRLLRQDSTEAAHDVLVELVSDPALASYRSVLVAAVAHQLEVARDAVARPWTEDDVLAVERGDERPPRSLDDLFSMVRSHIVHVDRLISVDDDFSYRSVFDENTLEEKIQLWTASCLRARSRGLYSVIRENVVAEKKEVDISAMAPGAGQVPIEIKPLGPYSFNALKVVIVDQLLGQYMRPKERRCGVLLLVRRERTRWSINGRPRTLDTLVSELQAFADIVGSKEGKTIVVETIDLLEQSGSSSLRRGLR